MRIIFKVFFELVTILFLFFMFGVFFLPQGMWDLSFQPGIKPIPPALEGEVLTIGWRSLNHWMAREVPEKFFSSDILSSIRLCEQIIF